MANNYVQPGNVIDIVADADLKSGVPVIVGSLLAVPLVDISAGQTGSGQIEGVFELPKASAEVIGAGVRVGWTAATAQVDSNGGDLKHCGVTTFAAGAGQTTVNVKLTPGTGAPA